MKTNNNSGVILVAVVCFTAITAILALGLWSESSSQLKLAGRQVRLEQAFYVAEGGAECAAAYISNDGTVPTNLTGTIGNSNWNYAVSIVPLPAGTGTVRFGINSTGTVEGVRRTVILEGECHQASWARFALWSNKGTWLNQLPLCFVGGEICDGPVHANCGIFLYGDPVFNGRISSTESAWSPLFGRPSDTSSVSFNGGYLLNAPVQSMPSVNFSDLRSQANLVVTGKTSITLAGTNMVISNSGRNWTMNTIPIPPECLVCSKDASGAGFFNDLFRGGSKRGTISVGGTLDGRMTIASDCDIWITNNITYAVHPTNNSDDVLGLIAARNVIVTREAPNDLDVFAHIMATGMATPSFEFDGHFGVLDFDSRDGGYLNLYGGIIQNSYGLIGFLGTLFGFDPNYTYDTRLETHPPPYYPTITNEYSWIWSGWRER